MGQGGSKHRDVDEAVFSGVRITPELVGQLSGTPVSRKDPRSSSSGRGDGGGRGSEAQAMRSHAPPSQVDQDVAMTIRRSELLRRALERSHRVGDLLLAREDEELEQIDQLAEEIIKKENSQPSRARPCQSEAAACLQCYKLNSENPTVCESAVNAYSTCAREAAATVLHTAA
ncbi:hypothetical protein Ndes2526B_g04619 [Nannochloris sp. 'desiccata']|nr:hypothetical protein KSW81_000652 [Chlorella desiccata (nom. nud.)]KAH7620699.1 hypothetical protein NADE_003312 [Chlorella desiccata (nom. nud.)]